MSCVMPPFSAAQIAFMQGEEKSILELVPDSQITITSKQDGNWSDPLTWGGLVPKATDNVLVAPGNNVVPDGDCFFNNLRVDGNLKVSRSNSSRLVTPGIIVGNYSGNIDFGSVLDPIPINVMTGITWLDPNPLDRVADPKALGRGLIVLGQMLSSGQMGAMGTLSICGSQITPWIELPPGIGFSSGLTTVNLIAIPSDWLVGHYILFPGTDPSKTTSEIRKIKAINGNSITLDSPLAYSHIPGKGTSVNGSLHIGNMSRNVIFQAIATDPQRSAHVMYMHTDQIDIRYSCYLNMGRTDKSKILNDSVIVNGVLQPGTGLDPRARYSGFHAHRVYNFDPGCEINYIGNVVWNSPGWGVTNHSSHVLVDQNIIYNCYGAGFAAEVGDEKGTVSNNLIVSCLGGHKVGDDVDPFTSAGIDGPVGTRSHAQDYGFNGDGVWLQVKYGVRVHSNHFYECTESGIYAFGTGLRQPVISPNQQQCWTNSIADSELVDLVRWPVITPVGNLPLYGCDDNTFTACNQCIYLAGNGSGVHGDTRSGIHNVTGFNIYRNGIESAYSKDANITGQITIISSPGRLDSVQCRAIAMTFGYSGNISVNGIFTIEGFHRGVEIPNIGSNIWNFLAGSYFDNRVNRYIGSNNSDTLNTVIGGIDVPVGPACKGPGGYDVWMDPLGPNNVGANPFSMDRGYFRGSYVYINTPNYPNSQLFSDKQASGFKPFMDTTVSPHDGASPLPAFQLAAFQSIDKTMTNGEIQAKYGTSLWGNTAPVNAIAVVNSNGLLIGAAQPKPPDASTQPNPWRLLSPSITNQLNNYQLKYSDGSLTIIDPTPRTLVQGINLLTVNHNGILFSFKVYGDIIPPTWSLDSAPPVSQANLGNAYTLRGHLLDDEYIPIGISKPQVFSNLLAFPVQTKPDGSKFLTATWTVSDLAGNQTTVNQDVVVI